MDILIRKATIDDVEILVSNRMDFLFELTRTQQSEEFRNATKDYIESHINDNSFISYIAIYQGRIISSIIVCIYGVLPKRNNLTGKIGYIFNVYTLHEYRGHGLAKGLLKLVIDEAKQLGVGELYLNATDDGKRVYEKLNFKFVDNEMCLKLNIES